MTAWEAFKDLVQEVDQSTCPFCDIRHKPVQASPYCSKAAEFKMWLRWNDEAAS